MIENLAYFSGPSALPPSFQGDRFAYALSVFGLFGTSLLAIEWLSRTVVAMLDNPRPWREPVSITRMLLICLLTATLLRIVPDVLLVMLWPEIEPVTRALIARTDRVLDGLSIIPVTIAWALGLFAGATIEFQLMKQPFPADLWPTWRRVRRPLSMGVMILTIALSLAFLR